MNVHKFTATTSRDALRKVRDMLGTDAVILSNRTIEGGVEILALTNDDMSAIAPPPVEKKVPPIPVVANPPAGKPVADSDQLSNLADALEIVRTMSIAQEAAANEHTEVMSEIRSMRGMLETQLAEISWSTLQKREPARSAVLR